METSSRLKALRISLRVRITEARMFPTMPRMATVVWKKFGWIFWPKAIFEMWYHYLGCVIRLHNLWPGPLFFTISALTHCKKWNIDFPILQTSPASFSASSFAVPLKSLNPSRYRQYRVARLCKRQFCMRFQSRFSYPLSVFCLLYGTWYNQNSNQPNPSLQADGTIEILHRDSLRGLCVVARSFVLLRVRPKPCFWLLGLILISGYSKMSNIMLWPNSNLMLG